MQSRKSIESTVHYSLDVVQLPQPCTVPWESMPGDHGVRLCGTCRKQIHNLSALTQADAEALLSRPEGPPCVTFVRRADGTIQTADRVGVWGRIGAWASRLAALIAVGSAAAGCGDKAKPSYPQPVGMVPPNPGIVRPEKPATAPYTAPLPAAQTPAP